MRFAKIIATLSCGVSAIAATTAAAQTAPAEGATSPQAAQAPTAAPAMPETDIIVTGSRISRRDYTSESPIVTVSSEAIKSTGATTLEQGLNQLPQVTASASSSSNFTTRAGQANVNLRGLGAQRTLVLLNGRRLQPSGSDGSVDLNIIPSALVDNIEVITGGASSTYGSDAVAGVLNIKTKKHFTGVELDATGGSTFAGDGENNNLGITVGSDFADKRGNAYLSLNYSDRGAVSFLDRDYLRGQGYGSSIPAGSITLAASNLPTQAAVNSVFSGYGVTSAVSRSSVLSFNPDGTLFVATGAINYRGSRSTPYAVSNGTVFSVGGDYQLSQIPLTRYNLLGHIDYDIGSGISVFVDGLYTNYTATTQAGPTVVGSAASTLITVPVTNPFLPSGLRTILASRPNPNAPFQLQQQEVPFGPRHERDEYDVFQFTGGVDGKISGTDITWEVYGTYGKTKLLQTLQNYQSSVAVQTLLNAPDGGASICAGGYNLAAIDTLSPACLAYIGRDARNTSTLTQSVIEANAQGSLFALPAGELKFAIGADYRRDTYDYAADNLIRTGELSNALPILPSTGSEEVKEVYGELLVPIFRNAFFARELNLNLGYRHSSYRISGGVDTYKADVDWAVTDWLRLRGGYARAVRAPSVGELFLATNSGLFALGAPGTLGSGDPCDVRGAYRTGANAAAVRSLCLAQGVPAAVIDSFQNIVARTPFTTAGNLNLKPEISDTFSAGVVFRSRSSNPLFSRLTASVDYYNIKLDHAIGVVTNTVATSQCFDPSVNPTLSNSSFYCSLITRETAAGQISNVVNPELNLGGYKTSGVDVAVDWAIPLDEIGLGGGAGRLSLATVVSYLQKFQIQTLPGGQSLDYAGTIGNQQIDLFGTAKPTWKATSSVNWSNDTFGATFRWRYIGPMGNARNVGTGGTAHGVPGISYFDLDLSAKVAKNFELRAGIVNLFDKAPPTLNDSLVGNFATDLYTYDVVGRRFYVSAKVRF